MSPPCGRSADLSSSSSNDLFLNFFFRSDASMNLLYNGSEGLVYMKLVDWLENVDEDLQLTAVLAMGNFARTDIHCRYMVTQGIHRKLLKLLQRNSDKTGDIRCQHALLSALRNLVIPADNKSLILADGLIDVLYPMLDIPTFPVVFKLLGTLRIVIDGQSKFLSTKNLISACYKYSA